MGFVLAAYLLLVLVGAPLMSWRTARSGLLRSLPRPTLYRASITTAWVLALLGGAAVVWDGTLTRADLGLQGLAAGPLALALAATLAALMAGTGLLALVRRAVGRPESADFHHLVPRTRQDRPWFWGVALTAGLAEEFVYRGIAVTALARTPWLEGLGGPWLAAAIVAVGFGLSHGYQDVLGMLRAGLLGLFLAVPFLVTGSLLPGVAAHALIDLALLTGPGRALAGVPTLGTVELSGDGPAPTGAGALSSPPSRDREPPAGSGE